MVNRLVIMTLCVFFLIIKIAVAIPQPAAEFYGYVVVDNKLAQEGTTIDIFDSSGNICGSFIVKERGKYGYLSCNADDFSTEKDEGATPFEEVYFNINGKLAVAFGNTTWYTGNANKVDLVIGNLEKSIVFLEEPKQSTLLGDSLLSIIILLILSPLYFIIVKEIKNEL